MRSLISMAGSRLCPFVQLGYRGTFAGRIWQLGYRATFAGRRRALSILEFLSTRPQQNVLSAHFFHEGDGLV